MMKRSKYIISEFSFIIIMYNTNLKIKVIFGLVFLFLIEVINITFILYKINLMILRIIIDYNKLISIYSLSFIIRDRTIDIKEDIL